MLGVRCDIGISRGASHGKAKPRLQGQAEGGGGGLRVMRVRDWGGPAAWFACNECQGPIFLSSSGQGQDKQQANVSRRQQLRRWAWRRPDGQLVVFPGARSSGRALGEFRRDGRAIEGRKRNAGRRVPFPRALSGRKGGVDEHERDQGRCSSPAMPDANPPRRP